MKNGEIPYFVYINSVFSVIFRHVGGKLSCVSQHSTIESKSVLCLMSRSTFGFRSLLKEEEIEFRMVSASEAAESLTDKIDENILEGFEDIITTKYTIIYLFI